MTKATRLTRAAAARPYTGAADPRITIDDAPNPTTRTTDGRPGIEDVDPRQVHGEESLATMPVHVTMSHERRVNVWRSTDGQWWRRGGSLQIRRLNGVWTYVLVLHRGATKDDVLWLEEEIKLLRSGSSSRRWERISAADSNEGELALGYDSRPCGDPYVTRDHSERVVVCDEPGCTAKWHTRHGHHTIDSTHRELSPEAKYLIQVQKDVRDKDNRGWYVEIFADEFFGSPDHVGSFITDLQWMQETCRRANAASREVAA